MHVADDHEIHAMPLNGVSADRTRVVFHQPRANAARVKRMHARQRGAVVFTNFIETNGTLLLRRSPGLRGRQTRKTLVERARPLVERARPCCRGQTVRLERANGRLENVVRNGVFHDLHVSVLVINDNPHLAAIGRQQVFQNIVNRIRRRENGDVLFQDAV